MKYLEPCADATACQNQDFIWVYTDSGRGLVAYDPHGRDVILGPDADDAALGVAVREALAASRFLSVYEARKFFESQKTGHKYEERVKSLMEKHGYKIKSAMFKNMKSCGITLSKGAIEIRPSVHKRLDVWGRTTNDQIEDVLIPADGAAHEIGAALRLAFSRCLE